MPYLDDDRDYDFYSRDYKHRDDPFRERAGDPCPGCGSRLWQIDCPNCTAEAEHDAERVVTPVEPTNSDVFIQDDEIPF